MPADEFDTIARLFRPLTRGAEEALELLDDAAALPSRPGYDLILTKDALVEGVHFLPEDPLDTVAQKLLRVNLSDLAAKAAEPYGYFLAIGWPERCGWPERELFAKGLAEDGESFNLTLLGGDTTSTTGPLWASVTMLGWVPAGRMIKRSGAKPGDLLCVSGEIGRGLLGLYAAQGELDRPDLAAHYRTPTPRLDLRETLATANAAADISDGLLADAANIARASGCGVRIELEKVPFAGEGDPLQLATAGDDYEIVAAFETCPRGFTAVGVFEAGEGIAVTLDGAAVEPQTLGYRHR